MFFTVASPRLQGVEIPASSVALRVCALFFLFGPFGLAVGTGIGLLLDGLRGALSRRTTNSESGGPRVDEPPQLVDGEIPLPIDRLRDDPNSLKASEVRPRLEP